MGVMGAGFGFFRGDKISAREDARAWPPVAPSAPPPAPNTVP